MRYRSVGQISKSISCRIPGSDDGTPGLPGSRSVSCPAPPIRRTKIFSETRVRGTTLLRTRLPSRESGPMGVNEGCGTSFGGEKDARKRVVPRTRVSSFTNIPTGFPSACSPRTCWIEEEVHCLNRTTLAAHTRTSQAHAKSPDLRSEVVTTAQDLYRQVPLPHSRLRCGPAARVGRYVQASAMVAKEGETREGGFFAEKVRSPPRKNVL